MIKTVKLNSSGTSVFILQALFIAMQFIGENGKPIKLTGICDYNLVYAINKFQEIQRSYGYECGTDGKNDGSFGPLCWARILGEEYAKY